jgi:hypothetical protein
MHPLTKYISERATDRFIENRPRLVGNGGCCCGCCCDWVLEKDGRGIVFYVLGDIGDWKWQGLK